MWHKRKARKGRKIRRMLAKDVVMDEMNTISVTLNEKDSENFGHTTKNKIFRLVKLLADLSTRL